MSLRSNPLVSWSITNCYDCWIVSWSMLLSGYYRLACLFIIHMVLLENPFTSCIEKCSQKPLYVLQMLKVQALNRQQIFSLIFVNQYCGGKRMNYKKQYFPSQAQLRVLVIWHTIGYSSNFRITLCCQHVFVNIALYIVCRFSETFSQSLLFSIFLFQCSLSYW